MFLQQSHRQTGQKVDAPEFHSGGMIIQQEPFHTAHQTIKWIYKLQSIIPDVVLLKAEFVKHI